MRRIVNYLEPLWRGSSLPAVVAADDGVTYVAKFRGAGAGARALCAEAIVAWLAELVDLPVPVTHALWLDDKLHTNHRRDEILDLLAASQGVNVGSMYIEGATLCTADEIRSKIQPERAAAVLWFDAFVGNVDRTAINPNIISKHDAVWLIDHGAALPFHYRWDRTGAHYAERAFFPVDQHVLAPVAGDLQVADERARDLINEDALWQILARVPEALLVNDTPFSSSDEHRAAYVDRLSARLHGARRFAL